MCHSSYKMRQPIINLHPNEYTQWLHYYPFVVNLYRCVRSCNTLNDLSNKVCVLNKTEDLNLSVFNMITGTNESKTLTKYILWECKCKFDDRKKVIHIKSGITINVNASAKDIICEIDYIWNAATCSGKNGKYLASIIDDSVITCDEIIDALAKSYEEILIKISNL